MSILFENDTGILFSTEHYMNTMMPVDQGIKINTNLFKIFSPYTFKNILTKKKRQAESYSEADPTFTVFEEEVTHISNIYIKLLPVLRKQGFLKDAFTQCEKNTVALKTAELVYEESGKHLIRDAIGSNFGPATMKTIQNSKFMFPENCHFFCKDVKEIDTQLEHKQFDLILLDPPWWNKYIRRKRKKCPHAYDMMYDCDLKQIPIETLLCDDGIVVVWCTNSSQHIKYLKEDIFPKWNICFVAKWYWLKVTMHGEPICPFSKPPGKQPFEQILIGYKNKKDIHLLPPNGKLLVSVPSAIHSHKPPLEEVLKQFLPENPKCLEIFARYLLPNWTSYGNEVLRFQHECLYVHL